jgi:GNAT superfamily N-acetyltransferase
LRAALNLDDKMIEVVPPNSEHALRAFASFRDQLYRTQRIPMPSSAAQTIAFFQPDNPFMQDRRFHVLLAREPKQIEARVAAMLDDRYNRHWNDRLGHLTFFESRPDSPHTTALLNAACGWLKEHGAAAARIGFGAFEPGFVIDAYEQYLPRMTRHSLPGYHALLKNAGFGTEKGSAEYVISVSAELAEAYRGHLKAARSSGYVIRAVSELTADERAAHFTETWNQSFAAEWGLAPLHAAEFAVLFQAVETEVLDLSAIAYHDGQPVGVVLVWMEQGFRRGTWRRRTGKARGAAGPANSFAIGVCAQARGQGVGLALASHAYLQLIARGARFLSYGMVLDDNAASRRMAQKLGARVAANYLTYRREL